MTAERVASYRLAGRRVEVWRGDALELPASIALFGRSRALRARFEATAGRPFEPMAGATVHGRRLDQLVLRSSPRRVAVSLDYHPRRVRVDARWSRPNFTHIDQLSDDLCWALLMAMRQGARAESIVLVPLSCRNPEVVSVASALAVWSWIVEWMPAAHRGQSCAIRLVDLDDPAPYSHALEDRDAIVTRALEAGTPPCLREGLLEKWARHPFVRQGDGRS